MDTKPFPREIFSLTPINEKLPDALKHGEEHHGEKLEVDKGCVQGKQQPPATANGSARGLKGILKCIFLP